MNELQCQYISLTRKNNTVIVYNLVFNCIVGVFFLLFFLHPLFNTAPFLHAIAIFEFAVPEPDQDNYVSMIPSSFNPGYVTSNVIEYYISY